MVQASSILECGRWLFFFVLCAHPHTNTTRATRACCCARGVRWNGTIQEGYMCSERRQTYIQRHAIPLLTHRHSKLKETNSKIHNKFMTLNVYGLLLWCIYVHRYIYTFYIASFSIYHRTSRETEK